MTSLAEALAALVGRIAHLEGPLVVVLARIFVVAAALGLAVVGHRFVAGVIDRLLRPLEGAHDYPVKVQRARTLGPLMKNAAAYVLAFVTLVIVLREIGVDVQALLVSAGVLGLAVGLGAQTLIKDVITGFFILFEGLIRVDDVIEVGPHTGTVEAIGLRVTKMRMLNGALRVIPNGELTQFATTTREWARAASSMSACRTTPTQQALEVMERAAATWASDRDSAGAARARVSGCRRDPFAPHGGCGGRRLYRDHAPPPDQGSVRARRHPDADPAAVFSARGSEGRRHP